MLPLRGNCKKLRRGSSAPISQGSTLLRRCDGGRQRRTVGTRKEKEEASPQHHHPSPLFDGGHGEVTAADQSEQTTCSQPPAQLKSQAAKVGRVRPLGEMVDEQLAEDQEVVRNETFYAVLEHFLEDAAPTAIYSRLTAM